MNEHVTNLLAKTTELADSWRNVAAFLVSHPEIAERTNPHSDYLLCSVNSMDDPAAFMAEAAKAAAGWGHRVEEYRDDRWGGINIWFGPIHLQIYAEVGKVFARRVVGLVEKVEYVPIFDLPQVDASTGDGPAELDAFDEAQYAAEKADYDDEIAELSA